MARHLASAHRGGIVRRAAVLLAAVALAVLVVATGTAGTSRDAAIKPGKGIGKVELGMTLPQVRRAFGRPPFSAIRQTNFGARGRYVDYVWEVGNLVVRTWTVGFRSTRRNGPLRVVRVGTSVPGQRTSEGLGVGSPSHAVFRSYPDAACHHRTREDGWKGAWAYVQQSSGGMTAFRIEDVETPGRTDRFRVAEVLVQRSWPALEGGRSFEPGGYCPPDWREA